jgi:hypothetical protein
MRMPIRSLFLAAALLTPAACGDDDDGGTPSIDAAAGGADAATSDAGTGLTTLITGDWTIPAGAEIYHCVRLTVPSDLLITEFHPIIPPGTHHTVLSVDDPGTPDGEYACNFTDIGTKRGVYGTGVGANTFVLPDRVAMKVHAGEQLVLNLHLYNPTDAVISGTSGVEVKLVTPADVDFEADSDLFGAIGNLVVPPGANTVTANCTASANVTVFALAPHMHKLGVHMKGTITPGAGPPITLLDDDYSFLEQIVTVLPQTIELHAGDALSVECSYENPGATTIYFGDSSDDEMCFLGLYRYPAGSPFINCN